jgi:hypothetical protein
MSMIDALARGIARRRLARMRANAMAPRAPQQRLLARLVERMAATDFGRRHGLGSVRQIEDLASAVPLLDYAAMRPWWDRARAGEPNVTWQGRIRFFALSSGTTSGEKYLPVSDATIASNRRGGFDALVPHLVDPTAALFAGKLLFLGGSTQLRRHGDVWLGDNTGIMALQVPRLLRRWHAPDDRVRNMTDWEHKVAAAAAQTATTDLRMLAGVPSWIVLFGEAVLAHCRAQGVTLIDCQQNTQHLASLGAHEVSRERFEAHLAVATALPEVAHWSYHRSTWSQLPALSEAAAPTATTDAP